MENMKNACSQHTIEKLPEVIFILRSPILTVPIYRNMIKSSGISISTLSNGKS